MLKEISKFGKKAMKFVEDPDKYNRAVNYGVARYVKNVQFDKKTVKVLKRGKPCFDFSRLTGEGK